MARVECDIDNSKFADQEEVRRLVADINERMGFLPDLTVTAEKAWEIMRAEGIRPEDNPFTRELRRMRYGEGNMLKVCP